jgi:glyoxylase-like metal-dependent hydrolase (beta-lactamase superfamily II)
MPDGWVETIVADNPGPLTLDGSRAYVLGPEPCLVIDPGPALGRHLDALEVALGTAAVAAICITHHHPDHAAGAAELRLRTGAALAATADSAARAGLDRPELELEDGSSIEFGGGRIEVVSAPGHCPDHVCFHWRRRRALFAGDVILGEGTSMIAPPEGDMGAYIATLERLAELDLDVIYPGHGPAIEDPGAKLAEYLSHRLEREAQVIAALSAGDSTPGEIRAQVYPDLDPRLRGAAEGSVRAHLDKLVREGRVVGKGGRFMLSETRASDR